MSPMSHHGQSDIPVKKKIKKKIFLSKTLVEQDLLECEV